MRGDYCEALKLVKLNPPQRLTYDGAIGRIGRVVYLLEVPAKLSLFRRIERCFRLEVLTARPYARRNDRGHAHHSKRSEMPDQA